jgi:hypothetical protein
MKRRKPVQRKKRDTTPDATDDLISTSRALYEFEQPSGPHAPARRKESVEDPLQDWPESSGEADRWLNERRGGSNEERES